MTSNTKRVGPLKVLEFAMRYWRPHFGSGFVLLVLLLVQQGYGVTIAYAMNKMEGGTVGGTNAAELVACAYNVFGV